MSNPRITVKNLKDARELIETGGWCRFELKQGTRHCLVGAIAEAKGVNVDVDDTLHVYDMVTAAGNSIGGRALTAVLDDVWWQDDRRLSNACWHFNDAQDDEQSVLDVLGRAIELAESGAV